jgi:hypothetical protein
MFCEDRNERTSSWQVVRWLGPQTVKSTRTRMMEVEMKTKGRFESSQVAE